MKKIILIGESNSTNLGDQIICRTSLYLYESSLNSRDVKVEIFDISYQRNSLFWRIVRKCFQLLKLGFIGANLYTIYLKRVLRPHLSSDTLIVFAGGQMFLDYFIDSMITVLELASSRNLPVVFSSCGTGRMSLMNTEKLKKALYPCEIKSISLRDGLVFFYDRFKKQTEQKADVAVCCDMYYGKTPLKNSTNKIGWGCIAVEYYNQNNSIDCITKQEYLQSSFLSIEKILKLGYKVDIFTNGDFSDYEIAKELYQLFNTDSVTLALRPTTDVCFVENIQQYRFVIASRLHALIVSYAYDIPFIGLSWDNKLMEFSQLIEHPDRVFDLSDMMKIQWEQLFVSLENGGLNISRRMILRNQVLEQITEIINTK